MSTLNFDASLKVKEEMDDVDDDDNNSCAGPGPSQTKLTKAGRRKLNRERNKLQCANSYPCSWCSMACRTLGKLQRHVNSAHKNKPKMFVCSNCQVLFATQEEKMEHDTANHRFECDFCPGWRIRMKDKRDHHVKMVHGLTSSTCHVCGVTLKCHGDVMPHLQRHEAETGQRFIFQCEKCDKPHFFYTAEDMNQHMATNFHRSFGARKDFS